MVELDFKISCLTQTSKFLTAIDLSCFNGDDLTGKLSVKLPNVPKYQGFQ